MANETLKTMNTRIALKADALSNWLTSTVQLYNGEVALGYDSETKRYEIRIGTAEGKTWSELAESNIVLSSKNILNLAYDSYELSNVTPNGSKDFKFQLVGRDPATQQKTAIGEPIIIPEVDFTEVNSKIDYISGEVSTILETTIPTVKSDLSNALSTYTDTKVGALETDLIGKIATAKQEAITSAESDATSKANQALADAKTYANQISTDLSTDYQSQIDGIKREIADGIHFIGHVDEIDDALGTYTIGETTTEAKNGDLVILNSAEYIWSEIAGKWELFGDEGNFATKSYVDDAVLSVTNSVYQVDDLTDEQVQEYRKTEHNAKGDILINRVTIKDKNGNAVSGTDGEVKKQFTAYVFNGSAWVAMDGNYNAENTYLADDIVITQAFGQYGIDSTLGRGTIPCKGWNMKELISKSFARATPATKVNPTRSVSTPSNYNATVEVGTWTSGANGNNALVFTYTADGQWSNYNAGKVAGNTVLKKDITITRTASMTAEQAAAYGITYNVNAINASYSYEGDETLAIGSSVQVDSIATSDLSVQYRDSQYNLYTYSISGKWQAGTTVPVNNLGEDDPENKIGAGNFTTSTGTVSVVAGKRRRFWYVGNDTATVTDNEFFRGLATSTNSDFNATTKTKDLTIPAGTKRVVFAIQLANATLAEVIDVDGMGLNVAGTFTSKQLDIEGANGFDAKTYTVFECVNAAGLKATTYKIKVA